MGNCFSSVGDGECETSVDGCCKIQKNSRQSPQRKNQPNKKDIRNKKLETNGWSIEVQECSRQSSQWKNQLNQQPNKKHDTYRKLKLSNGWSIEVHEISRVSPVNTNRETQKLNKKADDDSILETSNKRCLELQQNLRISPPTTCRQTQIEKVDNGCTLETSNESEESFKFVPPPALSDIIQVQSREDFLLKDSTLAIRKDLPSLATSILSLFKENMNLSTQYWKALHADDDRYTAVKNLFTQTTREHFPVKIEIVENPFLKAFYLLKKEEYIILYGAQNVREELLFHGTKKGNITKIIANNFNWRFHGEARGHIFGMGTSFSPISNYSTNYCEESNIKVMILAQVLVSQECIGTKDMDIPPQMRRGSTVRFDSSIKSNRAVIVKYCDDEFYPNYIIQFKDYNKK